MNRDERGAAAANAREATATALDLEPDREATIETIATDVGAGTQVRLVLGRKEIVCSNKVFSERGVVSTQRVNEKRKER